MIALTVWAISFHGPVRAQENALTPENTVILANGVDARFGRDYSALLKHLRLEWVILAGATVPDAVRDRHVTFLGRLDAAHSGEILRGMMTALIARLPINFGLYLDGEFREEAGIAPDLWVPAADAVNYAVAAVRSETITTRQPLSPAALEGPFVPEKPWARVWRERAVRALLIALMVSAGAVWAFSARRKPRMVAAVGGVWTAIGTAWLAMKRPIGLGFLLVGVICLVWGGANLWRARRASEKSPAL
jgi:hypothetical protein